MLVLVPTPAVIPTVPINLMMVCLNLLLGLGLMICLPCRAGERRWPCYNDSSDDSSDNSSNDPSNDSSGDESDDESDDDESDDKSDDKAGDVAFDDDLATST
jgi:hypothetical protein